MAEKTRYSDEELAEFKQIVLEKLSLAGDYDQMMKVLMNEDGNDVDDTSPTYKILEEGSSTQSKRRINTVGCPSTEIHSRSGSSSCQNRK